MALAINKSRAAYYKGSKEMRKGTDLIVIHSTASNNIQGTISWFASVENTSKSSAHYVVGQKGEIYQMVDESDVAYHAGISRYQIGAVMRTDINLYSIGIEVVADEQTAFTDIQKAALAELVKDIMQRHKLNSERVVRHSDIAYPKGRKRDPYSANINWDEFKSKLILPLETTQPHFAAEIQEDFIKRGFLTQRKDLNGPMPWGEGLIVMNRIYNSLKR